MPEHKHGYSDLAPQFRQHPENEPGRGSRLQSGSLLRAADAAAADLAVREGLAAASPVGLAVLRHWLRRHRPMMPLR